MGCVSSKHEYLNHPRIFHVWNVDGDGRNLKPGRIEVTDSQLILYQKGNIVVKWPLKSLRRYGFDSEVFSFECGRRCATGPGVYAFKCKRAQALFTILQECINNSGGGTRNSTSMPSIEDQVSLAPTGGDRATNVVAMHSPPPVANGTLQQNQVGGSCPTVDSSGYLEPISANSHLHYPTGTVRTNTNGASSTGGFVCIHSSAAGNSLDWSTAVASTSSLPNCCLCGGRSTSLGAASSSSAHHHHHHHYTNAEIIEQAAGCSSNRVCVLHHYVNSSVIATENNSHRCCSCTMPPSNKCCSEQNSENTYVNSPIVTATLSPGQLPLGGGVGNSSRSCCAASSNCCTNCCVDVNTNYAKLDDLLKQEQQSARKHKQDHEQQHFYVNVKPESTTAAQSNSTSTSLSTSADVSHCGIRSDIFTSPTSPLRTAAGTGKILSSHCYANISSSLEDGSLKEEDQVNYAILDLDQNDMVMSPVSSVQTGGSFLSRDHSLVNSPVRTPEGYAQIDFDKTVALSNSANPCPFNDDSIRKTRHNAVIPCSNMSA